MRRFCRILRRHVVPLDALIYFQNYFIWRYPSKCTYVQENVFIVLFKCHLPRLYGHQIRCIFLLPVFAQFVKTVSYEMLAFGACLRMQTSDGLLNAAHFALTDEF